MVDQGKVTRDMAKKQAGPPFRHGPAQAPAPTGGRVGGPMGAAPRALGIKNSALGSGTIGNGVNQGTNLGSMKTPKGARPK
jgi:hypothetical protein